MKKYVVILLGVLMLMFCLSGCGTQGAINDNPSEEDSQGVVYTLKVNEETVSKSKISVEAGDVVVYLSQRISDEVMNRTVEGDFLSTQINETILNIDYPVEEVGRDGTTVVAHEYHMKDVPVGQVIHVTITKELQQRLCLESDIIEITCE